MTPEELARSVVETLGSRLGESAGRPPDQPTQQLLDVVDRRLSRTPSGKLQVDALRNTPADVQNRQRMAEIVAWVAHEDQTFWQQLRDAARHAGVHGTRGTVYHTNVHQANAGSGHVAAGNANIIAGRDNRNKQFQVGNITFGSGGLVAVVAIAALLLSGGVVTVVNAAGNEDTAAYQRRALATCEQVKAILDEENNEIFEMKPAAGVTTPTDMVRIRKDALLQVLQSKVDRSSAAFAEFDKVPVPAELATRKAAADKAVAAWLKTGRSSVKQAQSQIRDGMTLTELQKRPINILADTKTDTTDVQLNAAMSDLAGEACAIA
jgi:hypothetical protein